MSTKKKMPGVNVNNSPLLESLQSLHFLSFNARSLLHKLDELQVLISSLDTKPDVIAICETWCQPTEPDSFYSLNEYTSYRSDRPGLGGGALIYVKSSIQHKLLFTTMLNGLESVWVELTDSVGNSIAVASVYRPPNSLAQPFCQELETSISKARKTCPNLILLGDFNAKNTMWLPSYSTNAVGEGIEYLFNRYLLSQVVNFPTHIHRNVPRSCLDLIATTFDCTAATITRMAPIGGSDHFCLSCTITCDFHRPADSTGNADTDSSQYDRWSWASHRVEALRSDLAEKLLHLNDSWASTKDVEDLWQEWRAKLLSSARKHCQFSQPYHKHPGSRPTYPARPWITSELVEHVKLKHKLHRQYLRDRTPENCCLFTKERNLVSSLLRRSKSDFILATEPEQGTSIPRLNTLTRCLRKQAKRPIPVIHFQDNHLVAPIAKAEAFNEFFISQNKQSVTGTSNSVPTIAVPPVTSGTLTDLTATEEQVATLLHTLDTSKSAGYDSIPTKLLRLAANEIAPSLTLIFNASFRTGSLPQDWRDATVSPTFKKGDPSAGAHSLRPIVNTN